MYLLEKLTILLSYIMPVFLKKWEQRSVAPCKNPLVKVFLIKNLCKTFFVTIYTIVKISFILQNKRNIILIKSFNL